MSGKLSPDYASSQFNENLPRIPDDLLSREFETRNRRSRTLNTLPTENMIFSYPKMDMLTVRAKMLVTSVRQDLMDFVQARLA